MSETVLRQRRALRRAVGRSVIVVAMCAFAAPFAVSAQATAATAPPKKPFPSLIIAPHAQYGAPLRSAAGAALFVPTASWRCEDGLCGTSGVEVQAMAGSGGWRVGGGLTGIAYPFWADALVTVTRTGSAPRRASPDSTYVGAEGGFAIPVFIKGPTFVTIRPSIGIARRVGGTGASADRTNFTWSIGAHLMLLEF